MPYFKDTNNKLHFLEDFSFVYLLPIGSNEITDEEVEAIRMSAIIPNQIPSIVEMPQARKALLLADILDNVDEAIAAIPDQTQRRLAQIDWEFSPTVKRDSPLVNGLAGALALTDKMLDDLFIKAASL